MAPVVARETELLDALCSLTLSSNPPQALSLVSSLNENERVDLLSLANSHHVIIRALMPVAQHAAGIGNSELGSWVSEALETEESRINHALTSLESICNELESAGCPTTVMKSLDHWPDLGNDACPDGLARPTGSRRRRARVTRRRRSRGLRRITRRPMRACS